MDEIEELKSDVAQEVRALIRSLETADWDTLKSGLESPTLAALEIKALASACKKQDGQAATKAAVKLAKAL